MAFTIPHQATTERFPLPQRTEGMLLATPEMLEHTGPFNFVGIPGFEETGELCSLNVDELTGGLAGAKAFRIKPDARPMAPTPWHMHHVDLHIGFIVSGWIRLELEGIGEQVFEAGSVFFQPPRNRHRELEMAPNTLGFEITSPARYMSTFFVFDEETETYKDVEVWL